MPIPHASASNSLMMSILCILSVSTCQIALLKKEALKRREVTFYTYKKWMMGPYHSSDKVVFGLWHKTNGYKEGYHQIKI